MDDPLTKYIKECRSKNISDEEIIKNLTIHGWPIEDIKLSLNQSTKQRADYPNIMIEKNNIKKTAFNSFSWQIKIGLIVPILMTLFIFTVFIIQTKGFKTGSLSVTINGVSNPILAQVQSVLQQKYPETKINLSFNNSKNLQTGITENSLLVLFEMKTKLTSDERKNIAVQICNIYVKNNQKLDNLTIWSSLPKIFGIFQQEPLNKQSIEVRSCDDWIKR